MHQFDQTVIYPDNFIRQILTHSHVIAMIGASPKADRPSHGVMRYLLDKGHSVYPINPTCAGASIHGHKVLASVTAVPEPIHMVDIFRRSDLAGDAVDDAIEIGARAVWMQLGVIDAAAADRASKAGLAVIMDRCPVIEYRRLGMG
ncbi:MAG: CoA-binding protein [Verrucomicrobia bacterium]|nr:CoA-binding protein [Verrucomicrobiota bacterium]